MVEKGRHAPRSHEKGNPVSDRQGIRTVDLQALAIYQRNREGAERRPMLESAQRFVKDFSVHCSISLESQNIFLLDRT
jgi:hypothetical protein